jgi:hypothetical protein
MRRCTLCLRCLSSEAIQLSHPGRAVHHAAPHRESPKARPFNEKAELVVDSLVFVATSFGEVARDPLVVEQHPAVLIHRVALGGR